MQYVFEILKLSMKFVLIYLGMRQAIIYGLLWNFALVELWSIL